MAPAPSLDPLRRGVSWGRILVFVLLVGGTAVIFRQGFVAPPFNPLPAIDLARAHPWFVDWRLAAIKRSPQACAGTLKAPHADAEPIADKVEPNGCGWMNGVSLSAAGGARVRYAAVTCEVAVALALWLEHDVQPLAREMLGTSVASVQSLGSYACRNIMGTALLRKVRSQHAYANAVDVAGFVLKDGRTISIRRDWPGSAAEARFLRAVHQRACAYFRVALSPDFNAAHHDHFHFDRGPFSRCK